MKKRLCKSKIATKGSAVTNAWIALILLLYIGGKMIWEAVRGKEEDSAKTEFCHWCYMQSVFLQLILDPINTLLHTLFDN